VGIYEPSACENCNNPEREKPPLVKEIVQHHHIRTNDRIEQTLGMANYINDKLKEHLAWHNKKHENSPFG